MMGDTRTFRHFFFPNSFTQLTIQRTVGYMFRPIATKIKQIRTSDLRPSQLMTIL